MSAPLTVAYQVAIFDAVGSNGAVLEQTLRKRIADLGIDPTQLQFLDEGTLRELDPKLPCVGVLFTNDERGRDFAHEVELVLGIGATVVPVIDAVENFPPKVPDALRPINALQVGPQDPEREAVAALILELLGLMRSHRRLFISYRRTESATAALQLHGRLDARSFDVFLDTLSVRPADRFQETLWHRMADADLVVLLYTQSVLESGWVAEELDRASGMGITVLQVIWPEVKRDRRTELLEPRYLKTEQFEDEACTRLEPAALDDLAVEVERLRARALAAREALLVGNLCDLARLSGLEPTVQPTRYVDLRCLNDGATTRVIPALGVPDALAVQQCALLPEMAIKPSSVVLLYDALSVAKSWLEHLTWLDGYLPVKTVKTENLTTWLPTICR